MAGTSIANLKAMLTLDTSKWMSGFSSAGKTAKSFVGGIGSSLNGSLVSTVTGLVSAGAAIHSFGQGMEQVDRHAKLADRLGISVAEVQKLALAADLAGADVEVLAKGMLKMGKNIGSGGMTLDKRLFAVADAISQISDAGARAKQAEEIFGKGGLELINVLAQGGRGIMASANAIDTFGLGISRIDAAKIEAANDAWTEMKTIMDGLRNKVAVEIAPTITNFLTDWKIGLESIKNLTDAVGLSTDNAGNTLSDYLAVFLASPFNVFGHSDMLQAMLDQRADAAKNLTQGSKSIGPLSTVGGKADSQAAVELGSAAAASAIAATQGNPTIDELKKILLVMQEVARNTRDGAPVGGGMMMSSL